MRYYYVNAFTHEGLLGNPAAVYLLKTALSDAQMDAIAIDNQMPVTAFVKAESDGYSIRWKTPEGELKLCGHGTLAAAWVLFYELKVPQSALQFMSPSAGLLQVKKVPQGVELDFPCYELSEIKAPELLAGLGIAAAEAMYQAGERALVILRTAEMVKQLRPNIELLKTTPYRGIVVSAAGQTVDFVSRTFYPHKKLANLAEDAVTGSSHCALVPYWAARLGKTQLVAEQVSPRGGRLECELLNNRVLLRAGAEVYWRGA